MESHEAVRLLVGGDAVAMAKRLGLSVSLIHKWCEPSADFSDSGAYNPLDRICAMILEAGRLGKSAHEVYAPLRYLADGHGVFIPLPQKDCSCEQISLQASRVMKEVGEALTAAGQALQDVKLTPNDRRQILKEMDEAIHEMLMFQGMIRNG